MININPRTLANPGSLGMLVRLIFICAVLFVACGDGQDGQPAGEKQLYTCGMHPQVIQEGPGNCPICGMKLTPLKPEPKSTQPEHSEKSAGVSRETGRDVPAAVDDHNKKDKKILYWRAPMDPTYVSEKPGKSPMGMDLIPVYEGEEQESGSVISIDPATVQNIGIRIAEVKNQPLSRIIRTVGHLDYNEETLYNVNTKFAGWLEKLFVDRTGDLVKKGQPLFKIYSPELVSTQEEYLLAYQNQDRLSGSSFAEAASGAESLLKAARQRLKFWDISDSEIADLERSGEVKKTLTIYSPANGVVVHKDAIEGSFTNAGMKLFSIADLTTIWVYAHIFEYELPWIKEGQDVEMELPYIPGKRFFGKVDYIYPYLDAKTRDVKIRLSFHNPDLQLKPQMYANIFIQSKMGEDVTVVPSEAIIRSGQRDLVFLDLGNGKFKPQDITIGVEGDSAMVQVFAGVQEGQKIVTSAQFLLDSESRLREAIQKMLENKTRTDSEAKNPQAANRQQHQR